MKTVSNLEIYLSRLAETRVRIHNPVPGLFEVNVADTPKCSLMHLFKAITNTRAAQLIEVFHKEEGETICIGGWCKPT